ncbi:glycosyltransferase [Metabacillus sp. 113a]|uniref:glycosyltransferase n=1 Tax=Metabacillus sp. 113a TaxID=3404706 RepID=UPI003CFAEEEB
MKNVLILCEAYGGGVKTYVDSINSNKKLFQNANFLVLVSSKRLEKGMKINKDYIVDDSLSFGKSPIKLIIAIKKIHELVKKNNIDLIHANSTFSGLLIYIYSFFNRGISYIYTPHGYYSFKSMNKLLKKLTMNVERKINYICNKVIHVSNSEEKEALKYGLVLQEKSVVIFNGVEDPNFNHVKHNVNRKFTILNLARVDDQKNPFGFIEMAKFFLDKGINAQFIWAGSGELLDESRRKVEQYKLNNQIKFIGFTDNKKEVLSNADLYFSTSYYEGLPFSVIEAMSYKLPVILSDIVGHTDLLKDGENGYLFKHDNYDHVFNLIQSIILNQNKWDCLSNNSYRFYKEHLSSNVMIKNLSKIYETG